MRPGIRIHGDGVAARCCAHLLSQAGLATFFHPSGRPRLPAILLNQPAQALIGEVFGRDDLFSNLPEIRKRIVAWGPAASPVELDHSAVVVSEEALLDSLGQALPATTASPEIAWTVFASQLLPVATEPHRFGSRMAAASPVIIKTTAEPAACWMESVVDGWLFLIASTPGAGWLLAVGSTPASLLSQSRLIAKQIVECHPPTAEFAATPRIVAPLGAPGWIACGAAAMAFDPLCGDGTAHAIREAILASAVIRAAACGEDPLPLLAHYEARLTAGFHRHLAHCRQYYTSGFGGPWWEEQAEATARGLDWCAKRLSAHGPFRYKLNGFELEAIG